MVATSIRRTDVGATRFVRCVEYGWTMVATRSKTLPGWVVTFFVKMIPKGPSKVERSCSGHWFGYYPI